MIRLSKWKLSTVVAAAAAAVSVLGSNGTAVAGPVGWDRANDVVTIATRAAPAPQSAIEGSAVASADDTAIAAESVVAGVEFEAPAAIEKLSEPLATTPATRVMLSEPFGPPAVAAPLPPAVLPGALLIAGNWVFTKVMKRRVV